MSDVAFRFDLPGGNTVAIIAGILIIAIAVGTPFGLRSESSVRRRRVLLVLRILATTCALGIVVQPTWTGQATESIEGELLVLVDTSRSMSLPVAGASDRAELVREWAAEASAQSSDPPELMMFGDELRAATWAELEAGIDPNEDASHLGRSVEEIVSERDSIGAVLVVSDGADPELSERIPAIATRGVSIHTIAMPEDPNLRDDAIVNVTADAVGFLRQPIKVEVRVRALGDGARSIPIVLRRGDEVEREGQIQLNENGEGVVSMDVVPPRLGRMLYRVTIPISADDAVPANNERSFLVRVMRDRLRVLLVAGRPDWDVRFLRAFLKRDEAIDLISFFILRTASDLAMADPSELALIPFPTDELFREHLASFDLVIFQNFNYGPYQMGIYLPGVREYVRAGGSFAMLGGDLSFASGGYSHTPIAELLPVELPETPTDATFVEPFQPVVSSDLRRHPLVALLPDESANLAAWQELAPMLGGNRLTAIRNGAHVLLQHPTRQMDSGVPHPVLTVGEYHQGRVLALASDSSWRWGMASSSDAGDATWYGRFWDRALRWLSRDPTLEPCQVSTERERYGPRAPIQVDAWIRNDRYLPQADTEVAMRLIDLDGALVSERSVRTDAEGRARLSIEAPSTPAGYRIEAKSGDTQCDEVLIVSAASDELQDPRSHPELLEQLSEATGGQHFASPDDAVELEALPTTRTRARGVSIIKPGLHPIALLTMIALLAIEWVLRRRWGRS